MKKLTTLILIVVTCVRFGLAQDYTFKVLVNKGKNEVKSASGTWQPVKTGASLKSGDEVKVADNAYIGLIHASGKPLEVKQAGNYKVADLAAKVSGGASVLNKYTDFILSANTEKKNKLSATGAVHRGTKSIKVYLPSAEQSSVFGDIVILNWEKDPTAKSYVLNFKSVFGDDLFSTETAETTYTLNLTDANFKNEDNILIEVYPVGQPEKKPEPAYVVKKLNATEKQKLQKTYADVANATGEASPLNKLILAGFFEQNKLLIDASNAYLEAIKLAPDVQQFQDDYNNFLLRSGIKQEPKK